MLSGSAAVGQSRGVVKWRRGAGTGQIEDRRGAGGRFPVGGRGLAGGGLGIIGVLLALLLGGNVLGGGGGGGFDVGPGLDPFDRVPPTTTGGGFSDPADPSGDVAEFVRFIVGDVQETWAQVFADAGQQYQPTVLVLFDGATQSGCGAASSQTGPFYCPADAKVYLDLSFFRDLQQRFGAPGDFAQAYVIAHEFGHHVQNVLGISSDVRREQQASPGDANELSVRLELQADCMAGVWGHAAAQQDLLEPGDLEEGLAAAAAVGDDRIQAEATGQINPDTWTHGSSEQRQDWFLRGFDNGDVEACDTFSESQV